MDKLITGLIVVVVVAFFYWLYTTGGSMEMPLVTETAPKGSWIATVGMGEEAHVAGHYDSYAECFKDVGARVDVNTTPYSCTNQ